MILFKNIKFSYIIILGLLFSASVSLIPALNPIALYGIIPGIFLFCAISYSPILNSSYIRVFFYWFIWIGFTWLAATDKTLATQNLKEILGGFLLSYVMYTLSQNKRYIPWLYLSFVFYYIFLWRYAFTEMSILTMNIEGERLNDDLLNANTLAYLTFYSAFAIFILGHILTNKFLKIIFKTLFMGTLILVPMVSIYTASRQVLIIIIPFVLILLYYRYKPRLTAKSLITSLAVLFVAVMIYKSYFSEMYENSLLKERSEINIQDDPRMMLLVKAVEIGVKNPLYGVGPGNFILYTDEQQYSHCSYTELFANSGLLALILFVWLIVKFVKDQFQRYKQSKDVIFLYLIITGLFWGFYNLFFVFYLNLWLISFLFLIIGHSNAYYSEIVEREKSENDCCLIE